MYEQSWFKRYTIRNTLIGIVLCLHFTRFLLYFTNNLHDAGADRMCDAVEHKTGHRPWPLYKLCWRYFSPLIFIVSIFYFFVWNFASCDFNVCGTVCFFAHTGTVLYIFYSLVPCIPSIHCGPPSDKTWICVCFINCTIKLPLTLN